MSDSKRVKVVLQVSVSIAPENIELWKKHFKIICDQVVREPECAYFFFGEEIGKPGHFYWTEGWTENKEWLQNVQLKKPYYEPYEKATFPLWATERIITYTVPTVEFGNEFKPGYAIF